MKRFAALVVFLVSVGVLPSRGAAQIRPGDAGFIPAPGLQIQNHGTELWFFFDPLPIGTFVNIWKDLVFVGNDGVTGTAPTETFQGDIEVAQFPSVPAPAAWGSALAMLGALGLRRRRRMR